MSPHAEGLLWVRAGMRGKKIHLLNEKFNAHAPALCSCAPGSGGPGWVEIKDPDALPDALLCARCAAMREGRRRQKERMAETAARNALYALRLRCVAEGHLRARTCHRPAHVRLADAEARWNQRRLSGHTSR